MHAEDSRTHRAVVLDHPSGDAVEIDAEVAPLIAALWAQGINTVSSCEDFGATPEAAGAAPVGTAMVAFAHRDDAKRFARTCRLGRAHDPLVALHHPDAQGLVEMEEHLDDPGWHSPMWRGMVLFPAERIEAVTAALTGGDR